MVDNPKKAFGDTKPCLHYVPLKPLLEVAEVMKTGADKYGTKNWRKQPVAASTYYNAALRHMIAWFEGQEDLDVESKKSHLAHAICDLLIIMDGMTIKGFVDDRGFAEVLTKNVSVDAFKYKEEDISEKLCDLVWDQLQYHPGGISLKALSQNVGRPEAMIGKCLYRLANEGRATYNMKINCWFAV